MASCVCGRSDAFGRVHACRHPDGPRWSDNKAAPPVTHSVTHSDRVTHSVTHNVTHNDGRVTHTSDRVTHSAKSKGAARQARYRAKDPDGYRQRHRDYMRRRRAD